jgi:hypothetical protein
MEYCQAGSSSRFRCDVSRILPPSFLLANFPLSCTFYYTDVSQVTVSQQPLGWVGIAFYKQTCHLDVCLSVPRRKCVEKKNQLDITECFIALMICSTCFGHFYAHHQELETICVLLQSMVCSAWLFVVGGKMQGSRLCVQEVGCCTAWVVQHPSSWTHSLLLCTWPRTTSNQALNTIGGNNTHTVSSSWWWA